MVFTFFNKCIFLKASEQIIIEDTDKAPPFVSGFMWKSRILGFFVNIEVSQKFYE